MLSLGPLAFAAPWMLAALATLPVIYWLLRVTPPSPTRTPFPAIRLLLNLKEQEETPVRTPLWLLLFRMLTAAMIILALAQPVWNPPLARESEGPLILLVDDGWAAAARWGERRTLLLHELDAQTSQDRPIALVTTARSARDPALNLTDAAETRRLVEALEPKPYGVDRAETVAALETLRAEIGAQQGPWETLWLSDGIEDGGSEALAAFLLAEGSLEVARDAAETTLALLPAASDGDALTVTVRRPTPGPARSVALTAFGRDARYIAAGEANFAARATEATARFELPLTLRNEIARIAIDGNASAGAVTLLDESDRRRPVGLVSGSGSDEAQPLLSELHYVSRALEPYAELREGAIGDLIQSRIAVLVLADVGQIVGDDLKRVSDFVEKGGVLLRFAGPHMASQSDDLVPARLRVGGREIGGALSWEKPQSLGDFNAAGPFKDLTIPADIAVRRQVLAEPSVDLSDKTWARLTDGTPLVTAERRGKGMIVLFHVTANADWSNLPLSGVFVEMLHRVVALSQGILGETQADGAANVLVPRQTLDGFGRLAVPPPTARPLPGERDEWPRPSGEHPPGLYGPETAPLAFNLSDAKAELRPLAPLPESAQVTSYGREASLALGEIGLAAALVLLLIDLGIALLLRGYLSRPYGAATAALVLTMAATTAPAPLARADDSFALRASLETRLAYVVTGDAEVDEMSRAGLEGLTQILNARTAVDAASPIGVDIETDELAFFPFLYWPVTSVMTAPSSEGLAQIDRYMRSGGTIFFDTRDGALPRGDFAPRTGAMEQLRALLQGLDIPPLIPIPPDHVLTKAFYLMDAFPGRYDDPEVWVEAPARSDDGGASGANTFDGVTPIIIGANDWAAAWARDADGRPLAAVTPGGERQRELAMRFGVNLVMYTLTGNYKSDQVHVPALLERLGQ